jgi:hypothetical protein
MLFVASSSTGRAEVSMAGARICVSLVHCVRPRRGFVPAADLLSCIDKKGGKEATPADSALAMRGLPCAARSLRVGPNSLRSLRSLRSNSRPKSVIDARLRAPRKALCCSARPKGETNTRFDSLRIARGRVASLAPEAKRGWTGEVAKQRPHCSWAPWVASRSAGLWGRVRSTLRNLTSRRLSERRERSEQSEFGARPRSTSTAEQSASGRPPPSGPPFFGDFLSGKRKKVTALSGAYPDAASRSENGHDKARLRYLSPNDRGRANPASTSSARTGANP